MRAAFRRTVALVLSGLSLSPQLVALRISRRGRTACAPRPAVGEPERARAGPQVGQREVLADAAAVRLDSPVGLSFIPA